MRIDRKIILICLSCCFLACDSKTIEQRVSTLSSEGAQIIKPLRESYEQPLKDIEDTAAAVQATKEAVDSIEKRYEQTAATVNKVGEKISSTSASVSNSAQSIARRIPRSQKEANRIVYLEGREYITWVRGAIERFVDKNSLGKAIRKRRNRGRKPAKS
jgi:methyl-accepting chemotaxis protein